MPPLLLASALIPLSTAKAAPGSPHYARLQYQLGRAYFYDKQTQKALPSLERAAAAGSEQAQFVLGYLIDAEMQGVAACMTSLRGGVASPALRL